MGKDKFIPRYQAIYEALKGRIEDGTYPPGSQLPFERELCGEYGVQRVTIRKSLELLAEDGLIEKHAGRGSFVRAGKAAVTHPSDTILFLMRKSSNDIQSNTSAFNAQLFFPMEQICSEHGFSLLYAGLSGEEEYEALVRRYSIAGVYLVSTLPQAVYARTLEMGIAAVCINHYDDRFPSILPDNARGVRACMERLFALGHTRIAHIRGMEGAVNAAERFDSYSLAMLRQGLSARPDYIMDGEWTFDGGFSAMASLLSSLSPADYPTAVVAASDMMAIGCIDAIKQHGLRVPEDISVIGFDNIDMCKFCTPQLTSVTTDSRLMAKIAFHHLRTRISGGEDAADLYSIRLPSALTLRQSVAAPCR